MKTAYKILASALLATFAIGASAAYAPNEGTPFYLLSAYQQDEGTPQNLVG